MTSITSQVPSNFLGTEPGAHFELTNGQVRARAGEGQRFSIAYNAKVTIRSENGGHVMHVSGADMHIRVLQIR